MKIAAIKDFNLNSEELIQAARLRELDCDYYIFFGNLYQFPNSISLSIIRTSQQILEMLSEGAIVVVFASVCTFTPTPKLIFSDSEFEDFAMRGEELFYKGGPLKSGIHDLETGQFWELPNSRRHIITVQNDDLSSLPEICGNIEYLEVHASNCSQMAIDCIKTKYGHVDKLVENEPDFKAPPPAWHLITIAATNILCYSELFIDFEKLPDLSLIMGPNGSGKSSLIAIILLGIYGIRPKGTIVKKGQKKGTITVHLQVDQKKYRIHTTVTGRAIHVEASSDWSIHLIGPSKYIYISDFEIDSTADWEAANAILREICDLRLIKKAGSLYVQGRETMPVRSCSSGQKFLVDMALKMASSSPKCQILLIDECIDRLDKTFLNNCLQKLRSFYPKILIIGHRAELEILPKWTISQGRRGSILMIGKTDSSPQSADDMSYK